MGDKYIIECLYQKIGRAKWKWWALPGIRGMKMEVRGRLGINICKGWTSGHFSTKPPEASPLYLSLAQQWRLELLWSAGTAHHRRPPPHPTHPPTLRDRTAGDSSPSVAPRSISHKLKLMSSSCFANGWERRVAGWELREKIRGMMSGGGSTCISHSYSQVGRLQRNIHMDAQRRTHMIMMHETHADPMRTHS